MCKPKFNYAILDLAMGCYCSQIYSQLLYQTDCYTSDSGNCKDLGTKDLNNDVKCPIKGKDTFKGLIAFFVGTCHKKCAACNGPDQNDCTSCSPGQIETPKADQPTVSCSCEKANYYYDFSSSKCLACDPTCLTCSTPYTCQTCQEGLTLKYGVCYCPAGHYQEKSANAFNCKDCGQTCAECSAPGADKCTKCEDRADVTLSNNKCMSNVLGKYYDKKGQPLLPCDPNCKTCSGPSKSECLSCQDTFALIGSQCGCADGYFLNDKTNKCEKTCNTILKETADPLNVQIQTLKT